MLAWTVYLKIFTALLAIVDPIGSIPIFISMTDHQGRKERYRTARIAATTMAAVLARRLPVRRLGPAPVRHHPFVVPGGRGDPPPPDGDRHVPRGVQPEPARPRKRRPRPRNGQGGWARSRWRSRSLRGRAPSAR